MTEVPEHLLQRSRDRRSALGLGGGDDIAAAAAPKPAAEVAVSDSGAAPAASAASAAPAPATKAEPETKAEPVAPYVEAGMRRKKIPVWAMPVLAALPIWAIIYAGTLDKETPKQQGALAVGTAAYNGSCSACHGGSGGGASGPALTNLTNDFPNPGDQLFWVMEGSDGFKAKGLTTYGANAKPVTSGMPGWATTLTAEELIGVVRHEREAFSGEAFDAAGYDKMLEMIAKEFPDRQAEFKEAIDAFKLLPDDA